jgi:NADH-quinone oxidoreductase subunit N
MKALIVIALLGVVAMMSEVFRFKKLLLPLVVVGLLAACGLAIGDWNTAVRYYNDMVYFDNYALAFTSLIIVITLLWLMISKGYFVSESSRAEHATLILFTLCGGVIMTAYSDLSMFFVGLEILSISLYVLASSNKHDLKSNEAGMKYFLMGSFATGFLLFGMALIYGATASFNLVKIAEYIQTTAAHGQTPMFVYTGVLLMMVGLMFKVSAAPFHFWAPDVYEGAPTLITAFMATVVKTAAFAAFYRLFSTCFGDISGFWAQTLAIISAVTMLTGNILAVSQSSLKRMLAYSSIAHAGYMLMAIVAMNKISGGAIFLYATAYSLGSLGAFACLHAISKYGDESIENLKGFAADNKIWAGFLGVIVLSLAGIPPVAGFFAKYYIFYGVFQSNFTWLVLVAILSSLIGVYYYFRIIITMVQPRSEKATVLPSLTGAHKALLLISALLALGIGIYPAFLQGLLS